MNKFDYKNLTPFKWFVLENFPFIEADFDALTEWQLFCKLGKEINKIIDSQNVVGTEMEKFSQAFIELQNYVDNYFKNLDVQDEINNKLNEMAEDGTLENILLNYTIITKVYDTHQEMIEDSTLLKNSRCKTLGYYNVNDGGGSYYLITDTQPNIYYENLQNGLYAILINDGSVNVNQVGAKGDGITNDSSAIQLAINNFNDILFLEKTYLLETPILINNTNSLNIRGINKNSKIKINSNIYAFEFNSLKDKTIENLFFDINNGGGILKTNNSELDFDFNIKNINGEIRTSNNEIIKIVNMHHLKIENCYLVNKSSNYTPTALNLDGVVNGTISKNTFSYFEKGIHITDNSGFTNEGMIINDNLFYQNKNQIISDNSKMILFYDINNNVFDYCETYAIKLQNVESSIISNNYFGINNENCICVYVRQINNIHTDLSINENKFINYLQTMVNPYIKINEENDRSQVGLKIIGNGATGFKTFVEVNEVSNGNILNNTSTTSISPNNYLAGNSINNIRYSNNYNGGGSKYLHSQLNENRNLYPEYEDIKSQLTHNTFFKPTNANGFYLYITFANTSQETQLINLFLSKTGADSLSIGNQSIAPNAIYEIFSIFVPAGYCFKYNTANPSNVIIQNAHVIY